MRLLFLGQQIGVLCILLLLSTCILLHLSMIFNFFLLNSLYWLELFLNFFFPLF